jgi:hypothetical protein
MGEGEGGIIRIDDHSATLGIGHAKPSQAKPSQAKPSPLLPGKNLGKFPFTAIFFIITW